eukprot:1393268-Amorphochlora_amoeboformis.AAC.1
MCERERERARVRARGGRERDREGERWRRRDGEKRKSSLKSDSPPLELGRRVSVVLSDRVLGRI